MGLPPGPDTRVGWFELPSNEAPAQEDGGEAQGPEEAVQGGADVALGNAPGYTSPECELWSL